MKTALYTKRLFLLAFFVIIAANIAILTDVVLNRSSEQKREITLTERELSMWPYRLHRENSSLSLLLNWRALDIDEKRRDSYYYGSQPVWFDENKLGELGFDVTEAYPRPGTDSVFFKRPLTKEVYIVLEYNGEAYKKSLERAQQNLKEQEELWHASGNDIRLRKSVEEARERVKCEQRAKSRLFAIDAGTDAGMLKDTYADPSRFIIAKGIVRPQYNDKNKKVYGRIVTLSIREIQVPLEFRHLFDAFTSKKSLLRQKKCTAPRYRAVVAYGSHDEPWIVDVKIEALD